MRKVWLLLVTVFLGLVLFACGGSAPPAQHALTVTTAGSGNGTVTSEPEGIDCGASCQANFEDGAQVTLTATPDEDSTFAGWEGACTGSNTTCTVTMDAAKAVTARFNAIPEHSFTVSKAGTGGGTVASEPEGIDCGDDCSDFFREGMVVTLTATPDANSTFAGWDGDCSGTNDTCGVMVDGPKAVTATFNTAPPPPPRHSLTVSTTGTGSGTVISEPAGISCGTSCEAEFDEGQAVTLTATPAANATFEGWGGDCSGTESTCTVTMDSPKSVTATFNVMPPPPPMHSLTVSKTGTGSGTITSEPEGINCGTTCQAEFAEGQTVTLTATPAANATFAGWSGACSGTSNTCTVTMDAAKLVAAIFEEAPSPGPDLVLNMTFTPDPVWPGEQLVYRLTVSNQGAEPLTGVILTNTVPSYVSVREYDLSDGGRCGYVLCTPGNTITWELGALGAGQSRTIPLSFTVDSEASDGLLINNVAAVRHDGGSSTAATGNVVVGTNP